MDRMQFDTTKNHITAVVSGQIPVAVDNTQNFTLQHAAEMALARRTSLTLGTRTCLHCRSNDILLHGKDQNGRQRFRCRDCRKTYNILTGTPMARARMPEKWGQYLGYMTEHAPLREIVASGIGLHLVTAWRWRHRFLTAAANDNAAVLAGVIAAETTFFRRSFKGARCLNTANPSTSRAERPHETAALKRPRSNQQVPVLTALDSCDGIIQAILTSPLDIEAALNGRIAPNSVFCSDDNIAYVNVAEKAGAEHYVVLSANSAQHVIKVDPVTTPPAPKQARLGLRRVNNYHHQLKYLINQQCRGVATKYLWHYLGWHRAMTQPGFAGKKLLDWALA